MTATSPSPKWLTFQSASKYVGVSVRTLENWEKAGHLRVANVLAMGSRGRRLIDREALDQFIDSYVGAPRQKAICVKGGKAS